MIIPIRCFTCGKIIGDKWDKYQKLLNENMNISEIFNIIDLKRICCRRMLMTHVNIIDHLIKYNSDDYSNILKK